MSLDPISAALDIGSQLITRLFPDPAQQSEARLKLLELQQSGVLAQLTADTDLAKGQIAVDQVEAASPNMFVAGWRPFIGWVCGAGLAYQFVAAPLLSWGVALIGHPITAPSLDMGTLVTLLFGMLGLGGMRTAEVITGAKPRGM